MVKLLEANEVDAMNEEVDAVLTEGEEADARRRVGRADFAQDLSDGGVVGGVRVIPQRSGQGGVDFQNKGLQKGRAAARRAWMWNGTETVLPLAWNPDGTVHDGARRYLLKRLCLCCKAAGFRGRQCPNCSRKGCARCGSSGDRAKIIPCFYLRKEDVPYPSRFYGSIPCFLSSCTRTEERGFLTEEDMRMHADSRHGREYRAYLQTQTAAKADQVEILQRRVDELLSLGLIGKVSEKVAQTPAQERMARARAAKRITKPAMA